MFNVADGILSYILQCTRIMTLISPGDCTLQCGMFVWHHDSEFTKWQHPAMWHVALGWHAVQFAQTSAVLEFYIWFRFRPRHRGRHVILHQSPKFYPPRQKKITLYRFSRWRIAAILDFRGPIMGSLKIPCTTSYRSSIENIALNRLVFEKIAFLHFGDRQTNRRIDGQHRCTKPLSLSRAAA